MRIEVSIALQAGLLGLALVTTVLRSWIRLGVERRSLTIPDYLVWAAWLSTLGWFTCSVYALRLQIDHPLVEPDLTTDSVEYLTTVFISSYFFDVGLYLPKASLTAFYWWLIPQAFRRLRIAVYISTAYLACAFAASILTDTLIAGSISNNWSVENQLLSQWNSYTAFIINWCLNWSTDLILFTLPFSILNCLKLRKRQKIGLCGVFSLGLITITISLARFIAYVVTNYSIDDAAGNLWCTAEMCTATIVVTLPAFKVLIMRSSPANTSKRSTNGYIQTGPKISLGHPGSSRAYVQAGKIRDDEIELVFQGSQKSSLSATLTTSVTGGIQHSQSTVA